MSPGDRDQPRRYREARRDPRLTVIEGLHALKHALRFGADVIDARAVDPAALLRLARELAPDVADRVEALAAAVDEATYQQLAPAPHPTGIIALARRPLVDISSVLKAAGPAPVVLLDRPTHHGNIGAVIRVAAAAGAAGVLVTGPHDPWHPASVRGGAGLQFAVPATRIETLPETDRPVVALDPDGDAMGPGTGAGAAIPLRAILVFGSERNGISDRIMERADRRVAIPMRAGVSSLNLATAVAVTLYCGAGRG